MKPGAGPERVESASRKRYDVPVMLVRRRTPVVMLAALAAGFVALYPYLDGLGYCDSGGCPEISHVDAPASGGVAAGALVAVLVGLASMAASGSFYRRRGCSQRLPDQLLPSPEAPPPRPFLQTREHVSRTHPAPPLTAESATVAPDDT